MNILVLIKQVPDTNLQLKVGPDGKGIVRDGITYCVSPYDEYAIEEALRLREAHAPTSVVAVTLGPERCDEVLRMALAMGADDAVHLVDAQEAVQDPLTTARCIAAYVKTAPADLILCGRQAIDGDAFQVPGILARLVGWAEVAIASKITIAGPDLRVERVLEGGVKQTLAAKLPCVVSCQKGLNEPRYASLPGIMKARKREVKKVAVESLGVELKAHIRYRAFEVPRYERKLRVIEKPALEAAGELVRLLYEEARVI